MSGSARPLSWGEYHTVVPKPLEENLRYRRRLLDLCKNSADAQVAVRAMCKRDILFYINSFVWQVNPKKRSGESVAPFITWDFQEEALLDRPETTGRRGILWCYEHGKSMAVEKSREMGATWLFLIFEDWLCLFHDYVQALNISRSAKAVDSPSPNSLFFKTRFMHQHLPGWIKGRVTENVMHFDYHDTHSYTDGEASTGKAGVGGRASVLFVDEVTKIREATQVRQRTANTADCRFFNSTHEGTDTEFYKMLQTPEFVRLQMHWTRHPEKRKGMYKYDPVNNRIIVLDKGYQYPPDFKFVYSELPTGGPCPGIRSPWYDAKCAEIGSERGVAVELDINPSGSVSQFFNAGVIKALKETFAMPPFWEGELGYDAQTGQPGKFMELPLGDLKLWLDLTPDGLVPPDRYCMGADISTGTGATNSCITVQSATTGEKVAELATPHRPPEKLAPIACALGRSFADHSGGAAWFAWEHHGPGSYFGSKMVELGYPNIYMREGAIGTNGKSMVPGWYPSAENKRLLLESYRAALESRSFVNRSEPALMECLEFRYNVSGNVEHSAEAGGDDNTGARVNHGDRTIGDALAWMLVKKLGLYGLKTPEEKNEVPYNSFLWRRMRRKQSGRIV